jgi:NADPH:quinone reductase-like Zn-dependent oxidoreductase
MRTVVFEQSGRPEDVLSVGDASSPAPDPSQVLIRVAARTVQPADFLFISGHYRVKPVFPQTAGLEGVGTIVACGSGVTHFKEGQRVAFRSPGAWAEYAVAPESRVYSVPSGIPDDIASQFALNPLTAWGLLSECDLQPSSPILITAGRSVVARLLTKLARRRGLKVTLLVRDGAGYSAQDGYDQEFAKGTTVAETLQHVVRNGYFHAILDPVGGSGSLALMDALAPRGRLISYGVLDDSDIVIKASRILYKNMIWQGFGIDGWLDNATQAQLEAAQQELWEMLASDPDLLPVIDRFDLAHVQEAIRTVRETHRPGKVLLVG